MPSFRLVLRITICALFIGLLSAARAADRPPNIVFILSDDQGWTENTVFGDHRFFETPQLERLAARGIAFGQAYASPVCSPTRAALMTGLYPARTGITMASAHERQERLRPVEAHASPPFQGATNILSATRLATSYPTLPKALRAVGYATGHFGKWHLGPEPYSALDQGFEVDLPHTSAPRQPSQWAPWDWPEGDRFYDRGREGEFLDRRMTAEAIRFIETHRDGPFFCNLWLFSIHDVRQTTPELEAKYAAKLARLPADYPHRDPVKAGNLEIMDDCVGRILDTLKRLGLADRTIVVFMSDNGGIGLGAGIEAGVPVNAPLRGYKGLLYEGGIRVPLIVSWPGHIRPGTRSDALFAHVDWFPTLMAMVGHPLPAEVLTDGVDQTPALLGRSAPRTAWFDFWTLNNRLNKCPPGALLREGDWKLIRYFYADKKQHDIFELYNLHDDPGETRNLARENPARVRELAGRLATQLAAIDPVMPRPNPAFDPAAKPLRRP